MNSHKRLLILSTIFFLALSFSVSLGALSQVEAFPSWLGTWSNRMLITIDAGDINADLADFPLLIHLSASSGITGANCSAIFTELGASYLKIALTSDDGLSQLYVEVEEWNSTGIEASLWVNILTIDNLTDTELYFYFDHGHNNNTAYVGLPNSVVAENVWDSNYVFVSHMLDDPDTSHIRDSTSNDNDGTKVAANQPIVTTAGNISDAQSFDGINDYAVVTNQASINPATFTWSFWWNHIAGEATSNRRIFSKRAVGGAGVGGWEIYWKRDDTVIGLARYDNSAWAEVAEVSVPSNAIWYFITCIYDGTNLKVSVNNGAFTTTATAALDANAANLYLGNHADGDRGVNAILDEPRFSSGIRSASWVLADYESIRDHLTTLDAAGIETVDLYVAMDSLNFVLAIVGITLAVVAFVGFSKRN